MENVTQIVAGILASLGGGAVLIFLLSSWLGKLWAERLMQRERHEHTLQLGELRNSLRLASDHQLASLQARLEITKETLVRDHYDRLTIYRGAVDMVAGIAAKIELMLLGKRGAFTDEELSEFESQRLRIYSYLAMHAPQSVMDAHDQLSDLLLEIIYDQKNTTWDHFRSLAIAFLNEVRKDIGISTDPISYKGRR